MPLELSWTSTEDIALELAEKFPDLAIPESLPQVGQTAAPAKWGRPCHLFAHFRGFSSVICNERRMLCRLLSYRMSAA